MTTLRTSEKTREHLLMAAFREIHKSGFKGASLKHILASTGLTKGALYHHFPNKRALGYAVIEEMVWEDIFTGWINILANAQNPIDGLQIILKRRFENISEENIILGCPLGNLAQEMSSIDEGFRSRLDLIYQRWQKGIVDALKVGQQNNQVVDTINPRQVAIFIISTTEGCVGMAKNSQKTEVLNTCVEELSRYLDQLRVKN